jgi:Arc/MetJ-type ribon-helix-helix transcriptional regulator
MRNIVNISMPVGLKKEVDSFVKEGNYASTSEFIRDLIRTWRHNRLLSELRESQEEIKAGKGKILRSLKDLD